MIHRVKIERVSCDRCGVTATVEIGEVTGAYAIFPHAVDILTDWLWDYQPTGGARHYCPTCTKKREVTDAERD